MKNTKNKIQKRWRLIVALSILFVVALITQDLVREIVIFNKDVQVFEDELYRDVKDDVKNLVTVTDEQIAYIINNEKNNIVVLAKENISALVLAANASYSLNQQQPIEQTEADIVALAKYYNEADSDHLYYVYDDTGHMLYDGENSIITDIDLYNATDYYSRPYIKSLIDSVNASSTGDSTENFFYDNNGTVQEFYIYGVKIEHTSLILASYVNVTDFINSEKNDYINYLKYYYDNDVNHVYIISGEGELLYHQNPSAIGRTINDTDDVVWSSTIKKILDYAKDNGEGYMNYDFYSDYVSGDIKPKVAYVKYIEDWDVIVGASSNTDIYDSIINNYQADNYRAVFFIKIPAYAIIITLSILIVSFIRKNVGLTQLVLEEEEELYRKFADLTSEIIMITNKQGKIIFTNKQGSINIFGQRHQEEDVYFDQILIEEDGYFILYGIKEDLFVKFITEEVKFNNEPADLYIIKDVTDKIQTERKLEALSMKDELTGLGNRRLMVKDYNDIVLPHVRDDGTAYLAMIDLDNFKPANDMYGHGFGDTVLQAIAQLFTANSSDKITFYRIGGDEFAVLFLDINEREIREFFKEVQQLVIQHNYEKEIHISFSAGIVKIEISEKRRRFSDFYDKADKLLYKSKDEGKNRINF